MPKPYPQEFRDDVVAVARQREDGVTLTQDHPVGRARARRLPGVVAALHRRRRSGGGVCQDALTRAQG